MKKQLSSLAIFTLLSTSSVFAEVTYDSVDGMRYAFDNEAMTATIENYYTVREGRNVIEFSYEGEVAEVLKNVNYNGQNYTVILGPGAFKKAKNLKTAIIPTDLTVIPEDCFSYSTLESIDIPSSVTEIQNGAFYRTNIREIKLPECLTTLGMYASYFNENAYHGSGAFEESAIEKISIPGSVKNIGNYTFKSCTHLEEAIINEGVEHIGRFAFNECNLLSTVTLPSSLLSLDGNIFMRCYDLKVLDIPSNVNLIGRCCFESTSLKSICFPRNVDVIRSRSIRSVTLTSFYVNKEIKRINPLGLCCTSLNFVTIEDSEDVLEFDIIADYKYGRDPWVNSEETAAIGTWFDVNSKLKTLYLGRNIATWIPDGYVVEEEDGLSREAIINPFYNLKKLKDLTIGDKVTDASNFVFENYEDLERITFLSSVPPALQALTPSQLQSVIVTVPDGAVDAYKAVPGWENARYETSSDIDIISCENNDAPAEYFDLNGRKVNNPSSGIYICRRGSSSRVVVKH